MLKKKQDTINYVINKYPKSPLALQLKFDTSNFLQKKLGEKMKDEGISLEPTSFTTFFIIENMHFESVYKNLEKYFVSNPLAKSSISKLQNLFLVNEKAIGISDVSYYMFNSVFNSVTLGVNEVFQQIDIVFYRVNNRFITIQLSMVPSKSERDSITEKLNEVVFQNIRVNPDFKDHKNIDK